MGSNGGGAGGARVGSVPRGRAPLSNGEVAARGGLPGGGVGPHAGGMFILTFAALLALVGLLVFAFATNGNLKTIGLACFTAGLAAALVLAAGGSPVRLR